MASGGDLMLFDGAGGAADPAIQRLQHQDATAVPTVTDGAPLLRITARAGGSPWPGVTLPAPDGGWNLSDHGRIEVQLANPGRQPVKVFCRVDNPGADGVSNCLTADLTLNPGASGVLRVPLRTTSGDTLGGRLFGMRGYPVARGGAGTLDPRRVIQLLLFLHRPTETTAFDLRGIRATGVPERPTAWTSDAEPYFPLVDRLGQYRHRAWPGKAADVDELRRRKDEEERELERHPGPDTWNAFGGWKSGPQLRATGYFRVEKVRGRWWLVDPEGRLFWSHGVDCVGMLDATAVVDRESWFASLPEPGGALSRHFVEGARALKGHYAGRKVRAYSFAGANLERKYGDAWREASAAMAHRRLRGWALNTVANWSSASVSRLRRTAYTDSVTAGDTPPIAGSEGYWGKFPDVFDPRFVEGLRRQMDGKRGGSAGDPWCLGYFSDNELSWGEEYSLAEAALRSPAGQPAKQAFLRELRDRHGTVERLNAAWGTRHESWEALAEAREVPDRSRAASDLGNFATRIAETYFRTVRDTLREHAPHQLYLGCRFAWVNARAAAAAAKYCDVVSYNLYQHSVADFRFNGGADVPLLIGEFHFGALDRGLFHTGLVPVENQAARAEAYRHYVEGALRHPQFVGTHWFQWQDEPTTGRVWDEENYQIGLVDVADTPYRETVDAVRDVGERIYTLRWEER